MGFVGWDGLFVSAAQVCWAMKRPCGAAAICTPTSPGQINLVSRSPSARGKKPKCRNLCDRQHRPAKSAGKAPAPRVDSLAQRERDGQAKDILNNELKRLNERCQAATQSTAQQRCAADQAALKRELSRLP